MRIVCGAVIVLAATLPCVSRAQISFQARRDLRIGSAPAAMQLSGGASPRLLVASDRGIDTFSVDAGHFILWQQISEMRFVKSFVLADLTGSETPDLVCIDGKSHSAHVFEGEAGGRFGSWRKVDLPSRPFLLRTRPSQEGHEQSVAAATEAGVFNLARSPQGDIRALSTSIERVVSDIGLTDVDGDSKLETVSAEETASRIWVAWSRQSEHHAPERHLDTVRDVQRFLFLDVDRDGRDDLVVMGSNEIALHRADGRGWFAGPETLYRSPQLSGIAAADIDNDGDVDLCASDRSRSLVVLLINKRNGRFHPTRAYTVGRGPGVIALADVTGDSLIDALVLNHLADSVTILRGLGNGKFEGNPALLADVENLSAIAVSDFNQDSHLDLAAASESNGTVTPFLGNGRGEFLPLSAIATGRQPRSVVARDVSADGIPDLVVANFGSDNLTILIGNADGRFDLGTTLAVGAGPAAIATGAFRGKHRIDIAVANLLSDTISVLYGDGAGGFSEVATYGVENRPSFLIAGDLDRDGYDDLVAGREHEEAVAVLRGGPQGFEDSRTDRLGDTARPLTAEDFNADGHVDLVVPNRIANGVDILPGGERGVFGVRRTFVVGHEPRVVAAGDFNGDGLADLAVGHSSGTVSILFNTSRPESAPRGSP